MIFLRFLFRLKSFFQIAVLEFSEKVPPDFQVRIPRNQTPACTFRISVPNPLYHVVCYPWTSRSFPTPLRLKMPLTIGVPKVPKFG
jgi:hypothetical protein